jgi:hypothetical protein
LAFVHRQPPSGRHGILPPEIEGVFEDGEFPTLPCTLYWQLDLALSKRVHPNLSVILFPIVSKMQAVMYVDKSTARHALFCRSNGIKCLVGVPTVMANPLLRAQADSQRSV